MKYQVDKIELFRCKKGFLESNGFMIPFSFGVVFESSGLLTFEVSIEESFDISILTDDDDNTFFHKSYNCFCSSDHNDKLEMRNLSFTLLETGIFKAKFTCYDCIIQTVQRDSPFHDNIKPSNSQSIYYLELEGLKMQFSHQTNERKSREGVELFNPNNLKLDYTSASLIYKNVEYNQIFSMSKESGNIIVNFFNRNNKRNSLPFEIYKEFKEDYVYALALLNGAEVRVRKEFTGDFFYDYKIDSHVKIYYSFKSIINERYNYYIPLNNQFQRGANIINNFFTSNFDNYVSWNKKIDLNSILFYFVNSIQAISMAEVTFIQMIAFERLSTLYSEYLGEKETYLPSKTDFHAIKMEFLNVLEKYKVEFGDAYNNAKSKISNLNQVKRISTSEKMFKIVNDLKIPITTEIQNLIDQVRHVTIHRGELAEGNPGISNFYQLSELLLEIILRLVEYSGPRETRIDL